MRDPEVLERLDPQDILGLCKRLQNYMFLCSDHVAKNQNQITNRVRDVSRYLNEKNKSTLPLPLKNLQLLIMNFRLILSCVI